MIVMTNLTPGPVADVRPFCAPQRHQASRETVLPALHPPSDPADNHNGAAAARQAEHRMLRMPRTIRDVAYLTLCTAGLVIYLLRSEAVVAFLREATRLAGKL